MLAIGWPKIFWRDSAESSSSLGLAASFPCKMIPDVERVEEAPKTQGLGKKHSLSTKDGVFSNLMAKPEVIHIDQLEPNTNKPPVIHLGSCSLSKFF
jgi:hypothetical protein